MLKSLSISNFQSHKNSILNFAPGVNCIVGESDSGKTAILRALNWIITNRPSGDAFRSSWGGVTECRVDLTDGNWIARTKDKDGNQYELNAEVMKAMGMTVPESIAKVLNLNSVNIQGQMDSPFLLASSAGEVAQTLNEVVGLEDIDKALTAANRMVRAANSDMEREVAQIATLNAQKAAFDGLDELDGMLTRLEDLNADLTRLRSKEAELNRLVLTATEAAGNRDRVKLVADLAPWLDAVLKVDGEAEILNNKIHTLHVLADTLRDEIQPGLIALDRIVNLEPEFATVWTKENEAYSVHTKIGKLETLILEATTCWDKQINGRNLLKNMIEIYKIEMGDECLLCGQGIVR